MDDMGYGDIQALNPNGAGFETPHLEFLLEKGVVFTNAHSSASVCAPTRYALLTGIMSIADAILVAHGIISRVAK